MESNNLSKHIGCRIRQFRKLQGFTLQYMADKLNKSKATMSKYESGDITLDVETLYSIANLLQISINQLTDYRPEGQILLGDDGAEIVSSDETSSTFTPKPGESPFFRANQLYFYYYDGRYRRLKTGVINVHRKDPAAMSHGASVVITAGTPLGRLSEEYYLGTIDYSDMLLKLRFTNQNQSIEENLLYLFNPPENPSETALGILSGLSMPDQVPCAFKCIVSLAPQDTDLAGPLLPQLTFTKRELQRLQKLNVLMTEHMV